LINILISQLEELIPDLIFGYDDVSLEEVIGQMLKQNKKTIATAESCTGGHLAHLLTSISGSSSYFKGSIVAYDNICKTAMCSRLAGNSLTSMGL
jgi:nicotinamide-nucleotide amidase